MKFTFAHNNLNVIDLEKSIHFYKEALGLTEVGSIPSSYTSVSAPNYICRNKFLDAHGLLRHIFHDS